MNTTTCQTCGAECPATQQETMPNGGWTLPIDLFGGYGLFDDNMEVAFGQKPSRWLTMCHDCVVKFLTMFPLVGEAIGGGNHPNNIHKGDFVQTDPKDGTKDDSCCLWAWCWKELENGEYETYYGTNDGGWVFAHRSSDAQDSSLETKSN